jgi:putative membrane protein
VRISLRDALAGPGSSGQATGSTAGVASAGRSAGFPTRRLAARLLNHPGQGLHHGWAATWQYRPVRFLIWVIVNGLALAAAAALLGGIELTGDTTQDQAITLFLVALIFGVVNTVIAPVVKLLSLPFIVLTLGLLLLVINALMLILTGWISEQFGLDFTVDGFWTAVMGSIIITIATWILELVLPTD